MNKRMIGIVVIISVLCLWLLGAIAIPNFQNDAEPSSFEQTRKLINILHTLTIAGVFSGIFLFFQSKK